MLIGDGVTPGNEGRGYVLRRMLRRAVRSMRLLGYDEPSLPLLLPVSVERMKNSYPELEAGFDRISQIAYAEEEAFRRTLASGTTILDTAVARTKSSGGSTLAGDEAFALHDTYGFPIDLTLEMASEQGLEVDREGFTRLMQEQRDRAKADAKAKKGGHANTEVWRDLRALGATDWRAYQELTTDAKVARARRRRRARSQELEPGQRGQVVLDRTPFYAESGGQIADEGVITADGAHLKVVDVQRPVKGLVAHTVEVRHRSAAGGPGRLGRGGRRLAHLGLPGALRHPRRARGAAPGARPDRAAVRLLQQARLPAPRLRVGTGPVARDPQRDRGGREPRRAPGPAGLRAVHDPARGARVRGAGAVRRDLRRAGPRHRDRRPLVARALRWHPRRPLQPDRRPHRHG